MDGLYQFKTNWNISIAIGYTNTGFNSRRKLRFGDCIDDNLGFIPCVENNVYEIIQYGLTHLSISIFIGYKVQIGANNKHALLLSIGLTIHLIVRHTDKRTLI